jgi:hypothetical protein
MYLRISISKDFLGLIQHMVKLSMPIQFIRVFREPSLYKRKLVVVSEMKMTVVKVHDRRNKIIGGISLKLNDGVDNGDENIDWSGWTSFKKRVDAFMIRGVFEQAIATTAKKLWSAGLEHPKRSKCVSITNAATALEPSSQVPNLCARKRRSPNLQ